VFFFLLLCIEMGLEFVFSFLWDVRRLVYEWHCKMLVGLGNALSWAKCSERSLQRVVLRRAANSNVGLGWFSASWVDYLFFLYSMGKSTAKSVASPSKTHKCSSCEMRVCGYGSESG